MSTTREEGRVWALSAPLEVVTFDIYRDIHKGIRAELFGVTSAAGSVDPADDHALRALKRRFSFLVGVLEDHATHEDRFLAPLIQRQAGPLASAIEREHGTLGTKVRELQAAFERVPSELRARRLAVHRFYLGLASFTAEYLEHQDVEELEVMPTLATNYTLEELLKVNAAIVAEIPPGTMAATLALLLPAMNLDDRTELLSGLRQAAPPPAFAGVLDLARSVLSGADHAALTARLG